MPTMNLRLTHKANSAFRGVLGEVLASTLDPFCCTRKIEVVYDLNPGDVPLGSIISNLAGHSTTGRTGKSLDRLLQKMQAFMPHVEPHGGHEVADDALPSVLPPEATPGYLGDIIDALDALEIEPDEPAVEAVEAVAFFVEMKAVKKLIPKIRGADLLANLYRDLKTDVK